MRISGIGITRQIIVAAICATVLLLVGCGKKADLFLPEENKKVKSAPATAEQPKTETEEEKDKPPKKEAE